MSSFGEYHRVSRPAAPSNAVDHAPNYAARRFGALVAVLSAIFSAVVVGQVAVSSLAGQAVEAAPVEQTVVAEVSVGAGATLATYVARPGDSLWAIAEAHRGDIDRNRYLGELIRLNGETSIVVGQSVVLPVLG